MIRTRTIVSASIYILLFAGSLTEEIKAQTTTDPPVRDMVYLVVYKPGTAWADGKPVSEQNLQEHGRFWLARYAEGQMLQAGPFTNDTGGAVIFRAENLAAAKELIAKDPAIVSEIFVATVSPWRQAEWDYYLDKAALHKLNTQFIENFLNEDVEAHEKIIHPDFVCIYGNGTIVGRDEYMKNWATARTESGYTTFSITDEVIRIFDDMALVRSKTVYTKEVNGETVHGNSVYTDTYIKEDGEWLCIQAHITPITTK